jgi:DNA-binding IclR family transcriptional regulator
VGATGKAILAFLPESEMHEALESAGTDIGDLSRLHDELAKIRRAGAAISTGERVPGTRSISAPVFGSEGTVIASISILSLESRLDETDITKFQRMVIETAKNVSGDLGFAGH